MNIVVIDTRLAQDVVNLKVSSYHLIRVEETTPMPDMMRQIKNVVDYPKKKIDMLTIAAHGYAERARDGTTHDGFGMQLCREDLDMSSVHYFRMLEGLFESRDLGITLLGCGVAAQRRVVTGGGVKMGFGEKLCKAICAGTSTGVMASTSVQDITAGTITQRRRGRIETVKAFDPGNWEGEVWIFRPDGSRTKTTPK
jgi:hypothetical protein